MAELSDGEFPICSGDDTEKGDHSRKGGNYQHKPGSSKKIFKYPTEKVLASELIKRWKSKNDQGRDFCIPEASEVGSIIWKDTKYKSFSDMARSLDLVTKNSKDVNGGQTRCFKEFIESLDKGDREVEFLFTYKNVDENNGSVESSSVGNGSNMSKRSRDGFFNKILFSLDLNKNVIIEGVAGSGKSHLLESLRRAYCKQEENSKVTYWVAPGKSKKDSEEDIKRKEREVENKRNEGFSPLYGENGSQLEVVVFHPSTSYEEFVSGIRPNFMKKEGEGEFVSQEGAFVQMCNWAALNPNHKFLIFIDEINRANTARVFGDLMLVLEKSKRQEFKALAEDGRDGALFEASVQKMPGDYVRLQTPVFKNGKEYNKLAVPTNLHVLGTMNTTDRSVGTIDLALRRRFHWVSQPPYETDELKTAMERADEAYPEEVATWYSDANAILLTEVGPDARLGHAYFFGKDGDAKAIAEALITQLLEIIYTFNIKEDVLKKIGLPPIDDYVGSKLDYEGKGLGRRPVVIKLDDKDNSSVTDGDDSDSENEGSESTVSDDGQGDQ